MNERAVRNAFHEAIDRYCNQANAARSRTALPHVVVSVVTVEMLTRGTVTWIDELTRKFATEMLGGTSVTLRFEEVADLPEPRYHFRFDPPALPAQRVGPPASAPAPPPPPEPVALLTLSYDTRFVCPVRIGTAETWLALGRLTGQSRNGGSAIELPTYANWLPRGRLLLVRNHRGRFAFGRSTNRPQYEIRVDGVALRPGAPVPARVEGQIEYRLDGSSTRLTYRIDWEGRYVG